MSNTVTSAKYDTHTAAAEMEEIEKNKRKKALAALAQMEAAERAAGSVNEDDGADEQPKLSKKEMKELKKKQAKQAEKEEKKRKKKAAKKLGLSVEEYEAKEAAGELDDPPTAVNGDATATEAPTAEAPAAVNGAGPPPEAAAPAKPKKEKLTAEEIIRKERPPPRIRVMESSQPDYTALRLENIAITFRDQPVLKSATWGVQTGDRIGLVGANGAGELSKGGLRRRPC